MSAASAPRSAMDAEYLFDSSVWVAARSPQDQFFAAAQELILDSRYKAAALDLTLYEVVNAIAAKRGDAVGAVRTCRSIEIRCAGNLLRVDAELIEATTGLVIEHGLTSYDAAYVAVARRRDWTLVSTDVRDLVSKGLAVTPDAAV